MGLPYINSRRWRALGLLAATAAVTAVGAPAVAAPVTGEIRLAGAPDAVPGSYIVVLRDSAFGAADAGDRKRMVADRARELVRGHAGTVGRTYSAGLTGFETKLSEAAARRLAADPSVAYVEQNQRGVGTGGTQAGPPSWGLDRIDEPSRPADGVYTYPNKAGTVHAYVIDSGIRTTHADFGGRASSGFDAVDGTGTDCQGHGTHVAGTVGGKTYGVAKSVRLVSVRVLNCDNTTTTADTLAGVDWVTANAVKPAVANMSIGFRSGSTTVDAAVARSIASGVTYAVSGGNATTDACAQSPARVPEAITVGATTSTDARAAFSNYGTCLDLFAPGNAIVSAGRASDTASATMNGTSMAAPHVAGAAALILAENPTFTPAQVRSRLVAGATSGVVTSAGTGSPNLLLRVDGALRNPYTPVEACGSGYRVLASRPLATSAGSLRGRVYLLHNSSNANHCVVTMKATSLGTATEVAAYLEVQGSARRTDSGAFSYYAGPVRAAAGGKCIKWGGSTSGIAYDSPFERCA
ncbi:Serine protease, subtilisin family [Micromonospora citrea]|uniref:Serine protease, subtilisin family n=1 Tax=Micromonospora citrea TaxID=47855 RepID=A0A1C6V1J3_9ACTN|nr:S8 family peptidase [Micromonospora citrea]SCL59994.1 Serine protease, subtilisin family [Micromonospora citrea]